MISRELFDRVKENLEGKQKGPYCIDLVINDFCNLACYYCSGSAKHDYKGKLSKEILVKILDSAKNLCAREISLTSLVGEPTVFKHTGFLMEEIKKRDFIGTLLTNGTLLDLEFAKFMQRISWNILILSLDSFDPDKQYKLRPHPGKGNYLEKIIEFLEYTAKNNPKLNMNLNTVVNNLNYNEIYNYFKKAELYGVKNITLLKLVRMTDDYEKFMLNDAQEIEFKNMLKNINTPIHFNRLEWLNDDTYDFKEDGVRIENNNKKHCYFHLYKILIDCDGRILKCNGDPQNTEFNVYDDNLYNIYFNLLDTYKDLRIDSACWDICCSPIKALNQEINYYLEEDAQK